MKAIKAVFEDGRLSLSEEAPAKGPIEVVVVFPNGEEDPWEKILHDKRPRPALDEMIREVERDIAGGKTMPLDLDQL